MKMQMAKKLVTLTRVEIMSGQDVRLHLNAGTDTCAFHTRIKDELPVLTVRCFIPELICADYDTERAIKTLSVEGLKEVFDFKVTDEAVVELLQMGIQWIELAKFFGYEGPTEGIPAVVKIMQAEASTDNCLVKMVNFMFDIKKTWDIDSQTQRQITGKAFGVEVSLRLIHTLGNFFIQGYIGETRIRIYKTASTIQVSTLSMSSESKEFNEEKSYDLYSAKQDEKFLNWLRDLATSQVS
jgi:hypothetical protein